ncbi:phage resistance protein [Catellatospora sp. NPDC049111]|uniref:phage resistance protein n=1 Tax=Catellatospora sp. NPDC049111 TaxID=3155271 RepID=UPI00340C4A58
MTLLRDLIDIPESVSDADFVVTASRAAELRKYVVTDQLRDSFADALATIGHAATTGHSQAKFLHGSFGSGKSHFMSVLREILKHNPEVRQQVRNLGGPLDKADGWLAGRKVLTLTFHMIDATSVEQAVLQGYLRQVSSLHPEAPVPAVHRSDALLADAARLRGQLGDDKFFAAMAGTGAGPGGGGGLAGHLARAVGWTADTYAAAAAAPPGDERRDKLVGALISTFFSGAVHGGQYLDLDTGLAVITRHAKELGYDLMVLFLDELILWLSTKIADHTFVTTEGAKLNKLVESSDATRPLPIVSFVARQRNLEEFLGPQVGGTERQALGDVMVHVQGRFGEIVLADTNLPEIAEKRLLKPLAEDGRRVLDAAFEAVKGNRAVWDTLLLGAQYGDAGIGSDAAAFRKLYPFSPALVATLVALSQALQRERTALKVMTELLVARRDTLRVNDLIGVAALFEPLVVHGRLPDRAELKQRFQAARDTYLSKLRPLLLTRNGITEAQAAEHEQFQLDDRLIKTLLLGAVVPEVPALTNLTAAKLHALNFGTITSPIPGYEAQIVVGRLKQLAADAGELHYSEGPDPVFSVKLSTVDYDQLLERAPLGASSTGMQQELMRDLVCAELGLPDPSGSFGELTHPRDWRGRRHFIQIKFGNVRDRDTMPESALVNQADTWRIVIDYPFDPGYRRNSDAARIETLPRGSRTVFWLPLFLSDDMMGRVAQLAKVNYLLGGVEDRISTLAADWSLSDRQQGKVYLQQRQQQLRQSLVEALKQAYGAAKPQPSDVEQDTVPVLHTLAEALNIGDPRGGTLKTAFDNLTGELLAWAYPGKPQLPDDEKPISKAELAKVLHYARLASADATKGTNVEPADRRTMQRICNHLELGELAENRYVLTMSTCLWSRKLLQEAGHQGYTDHFPVHVLRELLDKPGARGFDHDLQNTIIAVFALEQQLAWYQHGGKVEVRSIADINDRLELRHPPMPSEQAWTATVQRAQSIFGEVLPVTRIPVNLSEAAKLRGKAGRWSPAAAEVVSHLERHAPLLGLELDQATGRLATARQAAAFAREVAAESDDVVLIELVAATRFGDLDDQTIGKALSSADQVRQALAAAPWEMLEAVGTRAVSEEQAREILEKLRSVAGFDQSPAADLTTCLRDVAAAASKVLAVVPPQPPSQLPPGKPPVQPPPGQEGQDPPQSGSVSPAIPKPRTAYEDVADMASLAEVRRKIEAEVSAGRKVRITWEVLQP